MGVYRNLCLHVLILYITDRTVKPSLTCPPNLELSVTNISPETYDITQHVTSDGTVTFSQEMVTVSVSNIGTYVRIDVTAKNQFDTEAYCSFLVTFKGKVQFLYSGLLWSGKTTGK